MFGTGRPGIFILVRMQPQQTPEAFQKREQEAHVLGSKAAALKDYLISLDARRQGNREANNALRRNAPAEQRVWVSAGDIFIRFGTNDAKKVIVQDNSCIDDEIDSSRRELKSVIEKIQVLYGHCDRTFSNLQGISQREIESILGPIQEE